MLRVRNGKETIILGLSIISVILCVWINYLMFKTGLVSSSLNYIFIGILFLFIGILFLFIGILTVKKIRGELE